MTAGDGVISGAQEAIPVCCGVPQELEGTL